MNAAREQVYGYRIYGYGLCGYRIYEYSGYNGVCYDIALYIYAVMVNYLGYSIQYMVMDVRFLFKCHYFPLVLFVVSISINVF